MGRLSDPEAALAARNGLDLSVLESVKEKVGREFTQLTCRDSDWPPDQVNGVKCDADPEMIGSLLRELGPRIEDEGHRLYALDRGLSSENAMIAVLKTEDPFKILAIQGTTGCNYGLVLEDVVRKLESFGKRCRLRILGADSNSVWVQFPDPPREITAFAADLAEFCPDLVPEGKKSLEILKKNLRERNSFTLWWD